MRRVVVTGNSGSGKSTFAVKLGQLLDLPVIHIDLLHMRDDGSRVSDQELHRRVVEAASTDRWVFEGFNTETFHDRAHRADTLIFLDLPNWVCAWRVLFNRRARVGVVPGYQHGWRDHLRFLRWIWIFPTDRRPGTLADLSKYEGEKQVVMLRSPREVRRFLRGSRGRHRP